MSRTRYDFSKKYQHVLEVLLFLNQRPMTTASLPNRRDTACNTACCPKDPGSPRDHHSPPMLDFLPRLGQSRTTLVDNHRLIFPEAPHILQLMRRTAPRCLQSLHEPVSVQKSIVAQAQ